MDAPLRKHTLKSRLNNPWSALTISAALTALAQAAPTQPDALLAIDMQRSAVVEKIVVAWGRELPLAQRAGFSQTLSALRADHLLAASLSGSFDGVLEVLGAAKQSGLSAHSPALGSARGYFASRSLAETPIPAAQNEANLSNISEKSKALGDANADLVYTPLTPCRLFDTRAGLASALGTVGGTFSQQQTKTINPAGACGIPTTGVASLFFSFHAFNNNPAALGVIGFMKPAAPFTALAATWTGDVWVTGSFIANTNPNGSFDAFVGNNVPMTADMIVDVVGYFRAPNGGVGSGGGTITAVQTAAGSGLTGGVTSGAANLALANSFKLPQSCANQQVPKFNTATALWECQNDLVGTGAGGTGTVTNIATGSGLSGGPITTTGTISADTNFLQRRVSATCAAGSSIRAIAADGTVTCQADSAGPTNAWTQGGNAFGAPGVMGTTDAQNLTVQSGGTQASFLLTGNGGLRIGRASAIPSANAPNIINGSADNVAGGPITTSATVAGGGAAGNCVAVGVVGRPCANQATGSADTVSGGVANAASGGAATVGGGRFNTASGSSATVAGGIDNTASGFASFAGGQGAKTQSSAATPTVFNGAFVWSDSNAGGTSQSFHAGATDEFAVRARGGVRLVTGVDAVGLPTKTFSIAAASGDVNAPNIVTAQGKFSAPNNFPAGTNNKNIGDRFRDNSIIAWARIDPIGRVDATGRFGITSVTRTAVGAYTVVVDVSATDGTGILAVVTPQLDIQPTTAAALRIASVNQVPATANSFQVWMNSGTGAPVDADFLMIVTGR